MGATRCRGRRSAISRRLQAYARGRATVASIGGRYYGMDRDKRWARTSCSIARRWTALGPRDRSGRRDPGGVRRGDHRRVHHSAVIEQDGAPVGRDARWRCGDLFQLSLATGCGRSWQTLIDPAFTGFDVSASARRCRSRRSRCTTRRSTFPWPSSRSPWRGSWREVISEAGKYDVEDGGNREVSARDLLL